MAALAAPGRESFVAWTERGIGVAEKHEGAAYWVGPLLNNLGWEYYDAGELDAALDAFEQALVARERDPENAAGIEIALYTVGKTLRALGRMDEAVPLLERAPRLPKHGATRTAGCTRSSPRSTRRSGVTSKRVNRRGRRCRSCARTTRRSPRIPNAPNVSARSPASSGRGRASHGTPRRGARSGTGGERPARRAHAEAQVRLAIP